MKKLEARLPSQWVAAIRMLSEHGLRARVASIVWWDFFSDRDGYGTELEYWLERAFEKESMDIADELVAQGLIEIGYTEAMVRRKFHKLSQKMNQGRNARCIPLKRRDCHTKRAQHSGAAERKTLIA